MLVSFDPFTLLAIILACFFAPGILIALAILKGTRLNIMEKAIVGLGLGFTIPQTIPFFAYFFFGIKYTYEMALITVGIFWIAALALAGFKRVDQDVVESFKGLSSANKTSVGLHFCAILIALLTFWIRFGSYSPVFQELDPYYYTYVAQQIITDGYNPLNDQTAWYPEVNVSHRAIPELAYMESLWYSLYNGSNQYDNMLLAVIASLYPPIAAMLSFLFLYLFLSRIVRREYALIGAGIALLTPSMIFKLMAGEAEVQPYAFFAIPFFYALYLLMLQERKRIFAVLSGIAFFALALGSSSEVLATTTLVLFWTTYGLILFLKNKGHEEIRQLIELNGIALGIGIFFGSTIIKGFYYDGALALHSFLPAVFVFLILGGLYYIQLMQPAVLRDRKMAAGLLAIALLLFIISPLGEPIKAIGRAGFMVAQYTTPLYRTIAEQGLAGGDFSGEMGFVAAGFRSITAWVFSPITSLITSAEAKESMSKTIDTFGDIISVPFLFFYFLANLLNNIAVALINFVLGSNVDYGWKDNSLLMFWEIALIAAIAYWFYSKKDAASDELSPALFILFAIFPPFIVGIIKAKYTIYAAYFIGAGITFVLGQCEDFIIKFNVFGRKDVAFRAILAIGIFVLLMQFLYSGFALGLTISNFQTRFQDDPLGAQPKLQQVCAETHDQTVCAAASNPIAYASLGTNYQYNTNLCLITALPDYGIFVNPSKASGTYQAALLRCNRIADYWIESMEWIKYNTENDSRTTSWWDYGHWINFFGQKSTVLRNEHASHRMIGNVAYAYIHGTPEELIEFMKSHDSKYALFDIELIAGGGQLGAKYGALNYLSCAYMNRTNVSFAPGESVCETEHLWEIIYVPKDMRGRTCTISASQNKTGVIAYKIYIGPMEEKAYSAYYPGVCQGSITDARVKYYCDNYVVLKPVYCVGEVTLADGRKTTGTYYLNETYPNGDLKLNKAILAMPFEIRNTAHLGDVIGFTTLYTNDPIWLENGEVVGGYSDAKGEFYDSNLYRGIFLGEIPGFTKVFDDGAVKIYKINE